MANTPITIYDTAGVERLRGSSSGGGGSQPATRVAISFNTPNILTGVPFYTPAAGEVMPPYGMGGVFVTPAWDGTTPALHLGVAGTLDLYDAALLGSGTGADLTSAVAAVGVDGLTGAYWAAGGPLKFVTATPILVSVDDGNGGDPGASHGACEIVFVTIPAP